MSALTLIVLVVIAYGALNSYGYGRALAIGGATSAGAFVTVGATSVPTFYVAAFGGIALFVVARLLKPDPADTVRFRDVPGVMLLSVFFIWSLVVIGLSPLIFNGARLVSPTAKQLIAGVITTSNIAQLSYLAIGIGAMVILARARNAGPEIIGLTLVLAIGLSFWRYLNIYAGVPFPEGLFDNSPGFAYIETAPGGVARFRGIFSEPAALAGSAIVTVAYGFSRAYRLRGARRIGLLVLVSVAIFLGFFSTSTTFFVAGIVMLAIVGVTFGLGLLARRMQLNSGIVIVGCVLAIAAIWVLPAVGTLVGTALEDKFGSASYSERSGSDSGSYQVFIDSWGFGVGLGSGRASSILPTLLSTSGLLGTLMFAVAIVGVGIRAVPLQHLRPVLWALVTLFVVKLIAGPDPFDPTGLLWMCLGVLGHGIIAADRVQNATRFYDRRGSRTSHRRSLANIDRPSSERPPRTLGEQVRRSFDKPMHQNGQSETDTEGAR